MWSRASTGSSASVDARCDARVNTTRRATGESTEPACHADVIDTPYPAVPMIGKLLYRWSAWDATARPDSPAGRAPSQAGGLAPLPADQPPAPTQHYRAIFISDVHLGTRGCKASYLLDFLRHNESDMLYLVGDIIDGWAIAKDWHWPQAHNDIVQKVLRKARKGTRVVYVPGNHDSSRRASSRGCSLAASRCREVTHVHTTAAGASWGRPRRLRRRRDAARALARLRRRHRLRVQPLAEPPAEPRARAPRLPVLEPVAVPEAPREERRELHLRLRAGDCCARHGATATTASSADTSTRPRSATSTA